MTIQKYINQLKKEIREIGRVYDLDSLAPEEREILSYNENKAYNYALFTEKVKTIKLLEEMSSKLNSNFIIIKK